jgi:hypothetical protein
VRPPVAAAWPAFCSLYEGRCWWMYLDTKKLPTTGVGFLLETVGEAQGMNWTRVSDGMPATATEVAAEYKRVKALTSLAKLGGYSYKPSAKLRLPEPDIDAALMRTTASFWSTLKRNWPTIEAWPADAQLAGMDLAWQNGANFTESKSGGKYVWPTTRAAFAAQDWAKAASAVPGTGARANARKQLFRNAARVAAAGLDRDVLWYPKIPVIPVPAPVEPPNPDPAPQIPPSSKPAPGSKKAKVYVDKYGTTSATKTPFQISTRTQAMWREAVRLYTDAGGVTRPYITQGGYNAGGVVSASQGTHDGDAIDEMTKDMTAKERKLWEQCAWVVGFAAWLRVYIPGVWPMHCHMIPKGGDISRGAQNQVDQFAQSRNGLAGRGAYGRITKLGVAHVTWEDYLSRWGVSLSGLQTALDKRTTTNDVRELQWALSRHLGTDLAVDGDPGPVTKAALAKVGPLTVDTLTLLDLVVNP